MTHDVMEKYVLTVGIECHVQLATASKLFSAADNDARDKAPNEAVSPVDYALPGMLPVLNRGAVVLAVRAAKALNATVSKVSRFDRKHYFYPDLPKGYQTTQLYHPIILGGFVDVPLDNGSAVQVRIHHAHLEEDAGKLTHYGEYSLVDLNRAGTPLIEIVSLPDMHSAAEAKAYAAELYRLMTYAGVTHGDLYHGNMRFDVNISVAPKDAATLGIRTEVKNLNSFRSVEKAVEYESRRQAELLERGEAVVQETRGWDEAAGKTTQQRSKEEAQDYRYMPDPDIPPVVLTDEEIAEFQDALPMLPSDYRLRWGVMELDQSVIDALLATPLHAQLVTDIQEQAGDATARRVAHWFASALGHREDESQTTIINPVPDRFIEPSLMVEHNELSSTAAKEVFIELIANDTSARKVAEAKNLLQISDENAVATIIDAILADPTNQKAIADIKSGNEKVIGFLVGQVMKSSKGKANPALAETIIRERLIS